MSFDTHTPSYAIAGDRLLAVGCSGLDLEGVAIIKRESAKTDRLIARARYRGKPVVVRLESTGGKTNAAETLERKKSLIRLLRSQAGGRTRVPQLLLAAERHGVSVEIYERVPGKQLVHGMKRSGIGAFEEALRFIGTAGQAMKRGSTLPVPVRHPLAMAAAFPVLFLLAAARNPTRIPRLLSLAVLYVRALDPGILFPSFSLAHRDLTPENILVGPSGPTIIDWDVAAWTEAGTDLALFPRYFYRYIPIAAILEFTKRHLPSGMERKRFLRLSVFYTVHYLALMASQDAYYREALDYVDILLDRIYPAIRPSPLSIYERSLKTFLALPHIFRIPTSFLRPRHDAILCYHSVANDGDRFSTPVPEFMSQIEYLATVSRVVSLREILEGGEAFGKPRVAITFDDGYRDTLDTAYPLLRKHGMTAAVFVIGDSLVPGKSEYRGKTVLSREQIALLSREGWDIGFHTKSHRDLRLIAEADVAREVSLPAIFKRFVITDPPYLAYPFGGYSRTVLRETKRTGYRHAFTVDGGKLARSDNMRVNRIPIEGTLTLEEFMTLCSPYGMGISRLFMNAIHMKSAIERRFGRHAKEARI